MAEENGKSGTCEPCGKDICAGQPVQCWDDIGTAHFNCDDPWAIPSPVPMPEAESSEDEEDFLVARVSRSGKIIGIDHPTEAIWTEVRDAHIALRDRINERLQNQDFCPFRRVKPK
jgi:hypothetical protein